MGKYSIEIENEAKKELAAHYKSGDRKTIKRIERIFKELAETPYDGIGSPEPLKYELSGYWSRQINKKDRLIYKVKEETITIYIVSAIGHYGDKIQGLYRNSLVSTRLAREQSCFGIALERLIIALVIN